MRCMMSHRLSRRKRNNDTIHEMKKFFRNDPYGWNTFQNAVYHGRKFSGYCDEFTYYARRTTTKEEYLAKLWKFLHKTNIKAAL